jgi:multisubunit Na+/H+ antiporter MnhE subunit
MVFVWMLLWRDISFGTLMGGALVATSIELLGRQFTNDASLRPLGTIQFLVGYAGLVVTSNLRVAWEVITPSNEQIREAIVAVPLQSSSLAAALLTANAVSYTPGTLTVELAGDPFVLYVHVLHFESVDDVKEDVGKVERQVAKALAPRLPVG